MVPLSTDVSTVSSAPFNPAIKTDEVLAHTTEPIWHQLLTFKTVIPKPTKWQLACQHASPKTEGRLQLSSGGSPQVAVPASLCPIRF